MSQPSSAVMDLLHPLALAGWRFWLEEGRLRYRAPRDAATAAVLEQLREGPRPSDFVQRESGLPREAFLRALFELEADGVVQRLAGDLLRVAGKTG